MATDKPGSADRIDQLLDDHLSAPACERIRRLQTAIRTSAGQFGGNSLFLASTDGRMAAATRGSLYSYTSGSPVAATWSTGGNCGNAPVSLHHCWFHSQSYLHAVHQSRTTPGRARIVGEATAVGRMGSRPAILASAPGLHCRSTMSNPLPPSSSRRISLPSARSINI